MERSKVFSVCSFTVMIAAVILIVVAFYNIFKNQTERETEIGVIQRQVKGFALIFVANLVIIVGTMLCMRSTF